MLGTVYDATFLACAEGVIQLLPGSSIDFWTADRALHRQMSERPDYVRELP